MVIEAERLVHVYLLAATIFESSSEVAEARLRSIERATDR